MIDALELFYAIIPEAGANRAGGASGRDTGIRSEIGLKSTLDVEGRAEREDGL